jgi:hypothetical protein
LEVPDALIQYELPSSVRVVAEGLAGWTKNGGLIPGKGEFSFLYIFKTASLAHPVSCLVSTWACFPLPNVTSVWSKPLTSTWARVKYVWNHTSCPHMFSYCSARWSTRTEPVLHCSCCVYGQLDCTGILRTTPVAYMTICI